MINPSEVSTSSVPTSSSLHGKPEAVQPTETAAKPASETNAAPAAAKRGRKPGSVVAKKKPVGGQKIVHYFQVEKGYKPAMGKAPTVVKDFKDENEAYIECFKTGSLCIRGELFSVDIVGKTLTEIPVLVAAQPE
jgi:hypothetical protein